MGKQKTEKNLPYTKFSLPLRHQCGKIWLLATTGKNAKMISDAFRIKLFQKAFQF
jgi:hypothetical protein